MAVSKDIHPLSHFSKKIASFTYGEEKRYSSSNCFLFQKSASGDPLETKFP
jgi:hypothetical protein